MVLAGVTWILILVHPLFSDLASHSLPAWLQGFFPVESFSNAASWSQQVVLGWITPLLIAVYAAGLGSWLVAGEEERGSLGFLLSAPFRRYRLVFEKILVLVFALLGMVAVIWLAFVTAAWIRAIPLTFSMLLRGALALLLFGMAVGGLALALGCLTGRRRLSLGITLLAVLITLIAGNTPDPLPFRGLHWLSPFYFYTVTIRGDSLGLVLLLLLVLAALLAAWLGFERRDITI
jgi:ABC-2 type transport system permease protein